MPEKKPTLSHYVEYAGWRAISVVPRVLPRWALVVLADFLGWLMYSVFRVRRDVIDEQLERVFGAEHSEQQRRQIGLRSWQNSVLTFLEFLDPRHVDFHEQEGYEEYCRVLEPYQAIVITGHIGNWEAMGSLSERENIAIAAVGKRMHNPLVDEAIIRGRQERGLEVLHVKSSMKGIVDAVRAGKWIAILGDQDARRQGIFVPFFGIPASTAAGPALFAWKLNLPLLPVYCVRLRDPHRSLRLIFRPGIFPDPSAPRDSELLRLTELHTKSLEEVIRQYPENYFWLHRRWKTQPRAKKGGKSDLETVSIASEQP